MSPKHLFPGLDDNEIMCMDTFKIRKSKIKIKGYMIKEMYVWLNTVNIHFQSRCMRDKLALQSIIFNTTTSTVIPVQMTARGFVHFFMNVFVCLKN